jgi:acetylornithine aminotransferase
VQVLNEQAGKLIHTSNVYHNEWAPLLAEQLVNLTAQEGGCGFTAGQGASKENKLKVFFANSGTEANEGALKIARMAGKVRWEKEVAGRDWHDGTCTKTRIVCFEGSFHGRTMGALSVTTNPKYQLPFQPLIPGIDVGKVDDIPGLERLVTEDTCGVIIEPIQGEGGVNEISEAFLRALRKRCDEVGAILIFDEIQVCWDRS